MSEVSELIQDCERSGVKVSVRGQKLRIDAPKDLPDSIISALCFRKADIIRTLTQRREPTLRERINGLITAGVFFDVGTNDFQIMNADCLSGADKDFLVANKIYILCTLQQALLVRHLPIDSISDYGIETAERLAIAADGGEPSSESYFEIVRNVTGKWFTDLIEKL